MVVLSGVFRVAPDDGEHPVDKFGTDDVQHTHDMFPLRQSAFVIFLVFSRFHVGGSPDRGHVEQDFHGLVRPPA